MLTRRFHEKYFPVLNLMAIHLMRQQNILKKKQLEENVATNLVNGQQVVNVIGYKIAL